MIEQSQTIYFVTYGFLCVAVGLAYLKFKSTEGTVITTKEFQVFQSGFLTGYSLVMISEVIAAASFYHTLVSVHLDLTQVTKLYIVTIVATTLTSGVTEIVDFGTRKDKCVISALLYSGSMFSLFFGGHFEMLMLGRLVYGAASSLHHSSFEAYAIHEHASLGFPEDWLGHTFTLLTHCMALMAALSGILGQIASSAGHMGCAALCCALFAGTGIFMAVSWEKDLHSPRFMLSGFVANLSSTIATVRVNRQMLMLIAVSSLFESAILIFSFYWAPWMDTIEFDRGQHVPYEIAFACFILASMLGNYLFQMYGKSSTFFGGGIEATFQAVVVVSSVAYMLGALFQTPGFALLVAVTVQFCVGGYWPCIGYFRGRILLPEQRNTVLLITKLVSVLLCCSLHSLLRSFIQILFTLY
jgi:hypothetical protein